MTLGTLALALACLVAACQPCQEVEEGLAGRDG